MTKTSPIQIPIKFIKETTVAGEERSPSVSTTIKAETKK